jgi:hypothetical protein
VAVVESDGMSDPWAARLDSRMPTVLSAGERVYVEVICTNEGSRTWTPERPEGPHLALSYWVRDRDGTPISMDGERTPIPHEVRPGEHVRLQAAFTAPAQAGDYYVEWDMVSELECWFQDRGSLSAVVPLRVTPFERVERDRYSLEVVRIPASSWSPRFRKPLADVRVSVAVRAWNVIENGRLDFFTTTLDSLRDAGHPFDLLLVDNGSTDGTSELVAERGGYVAPRSGERNEAGHGMTVAIERALACRPDLVVFSDDDIAWHPGFLRRLVEFWAHAPHDIALLSGYVEPRWYWNTIRSAVECGGVRAIVRETAPGGAWTFPAAHWRWIAPLLPGMVADADACHRLRRAGFRLAQADLATHLGAGHSTWGNEPPPGEPVDEVFFRAAAPHS